MRIKDLGVEWNSKDPNGQFDPGEVITINLSGNGAPGALLIDDLYLTNDEPKAAVVPDRHVFAFAPAGEGTYAAKFTVPQELRQRSVWLYLHGVGKAAKVTLNGNVMTQIKPDVMQLLRFGMLADDLNRDGENTLTLHGLDQSPAGPVSLRLRTVDPEKALELETVIPQPGKLFYLNEAAQVNITATNWANTPRTIGVEVRWIEAARAFDWGASPALLGESTLALAPSSRRTMTVAVPTDRLNAYDVKVVFRKGDEELESRTLRYGVVGPRRVPVAEFRPASPFGMAAYAYSGPGLGRVLGMLGVKWRREAIFCWGYPGKDEHGQYDFTGLISQNQPFFDIMRDNGVLFMPTLAGVSAPNADAAPQVAEMWAQLAAGFTKHFKERGYPIGQWELSNEIEGWQWGGDKTYDKPPAPGHRRPTP